MSNRSKINIKDYSVSKENFDLIYNEELDMYSTDPIPQDIEKYYLSDNYISHTDSQKGIVEKMYQLVKSYMLRKKLRLISNYSAIGSLLDIGAGTGDFLKVAKNEGWEVDGIEPSAIARNHAATKGLILKEDESGVGEQKFDVITMWHVLEHVPNLQHQINWLADHLDKNGTLIIAVPNFNSYDAKTYKEFWAAWDVPRHLHHFSAKSIKTLFSKNGFEVIDQKPLIFDSFYVSLLSEKYKGSQLKFISAFLNGLRSNVKANRSGEYSSLIYVLERTDFVE
ncbi:2-polyprenyl-3-methyl-5-hydroxy-6-metoxy-1,4-benzoquinol methylase [Leeuwenhoekiella aestuarii]|uniref:2-polyprenyl-3-methyl-5-hydroxy-6-metoxy-1, 4-benzoquinol methylase n=1 Tax=Leeuwenhoekiella aestuarii TaxID=2249426 RepID=A0A4Q0NZD2_9FLAO|nr:class I SAM-dependent methyltransferase [Leeuwenhoekiella aestuarii]RXG17935.1 2-polyprenyl-3-methyl-5-hydroxy-6-metoxy-1,4-benzoquinol methylase [Leeuwenhoekiella aestuarii]RXG19264.1 2-polyprenyl-3-methyl-5-hydroxy-6-metoxy-1,4-benzoquinol methylase [Leeuwenhoekiella aestuarii]